MKKGWYLTKCLTKLKSRVVKKNWSKALPSLQHVLLILWRGDGLQKKYCIQNTFTFTYIYIIIYFRKRQLQQGPGPNLNSSLSIPPKPNQVLSNKSCRSGLAGSRPDTSLETRSGSDLIKRTGSASDLYNNR